MVNPAKAYLFIDRTRPQRTETGPHMSDPTSPYTPGETPEPPHFGPGPGPVQAPAPIETRQPDPGSKRAGLITWLILIPVLAVVVSLQQCSVVQATQNAADEAQEVTPSSRSSTFGLLSRFSVKFHHLLISIDEEEADGALERAGYLDTMDTMTGSPHEMLQSAVVHGEINGPRAALDQLAEAVEAMESFRDLDPEYRATIEEDARLLARIYRDQALSDEDRARIVDHHGWHGKLALTYGQDDDDPDRAKLIGGGGILMVGLIGFGALVLMALLAGFVLLIILIVKLGTGSLRMHFRAPAPGGSVYLETFAIFVGSFLLLQVLSTLIEGKVPVWVQFSLQWLVLLSIFWPIVRGVSVARWRQDMGLVAPKGVFREIAAGLMVYLASLPLYFMAALGSFVLINLREFWTTPSVTESGRTIQPPMSNPVFDMLESNSLITLLVLGSLVTMWAPLVEEGVMRGALFRHLRGRLGFVLAAIISAVLFGALHQYDVLMLLPVMALGASFAFIREWRSSLIGCITAHAIHNTTIFMLVTWLISAT